MEAAKAKEARSFYPGMGQAVAERTILRKKSNGEWESWADVAERVARGNISILNGKGREEEVEKLRYHLNKATVLMSGRHLQHGDQLQYSRNMEVFTNCSTSSTSYLLLYLLLNGSGVGRSYDDDMMLVNWDYSPNVRCVLDESHPDFNWSAHESVRDAKHKYGTKGNNVMWFTVPDSREGWTKALELYEVLTFEKIHQDKVLILDFSEVRAAGEPIKGMQGRPAVGPVPLMNAFHKANSIKGAGLPPWKQTMYIDHIFAESVLVGGVRRAARMSTKNWRDKTIFDFITIKRPIEYTGMDVDDIVKMRRNLVESGKDLPQGFLWSSNNSVITDDEFWRLLSLPKSNAEYSSTDAEHARKVFELSTSAAYADGTGEPGFINAHRLVQKDDGWTDLNRGDYVGSIRYQINDDTQILLSKLAKKAKKKTHHMIVNPCSEIVLNMLGGFCVIGDVVPFHADNLDEAEDAFRQTVRALMRVNLMDSVYSKEVQRTNRIGVGITGIHEFAWKFFNIGFKDLIDEKKSKDFWLTMARFNRAVQDEAKKYAEELGVKVPHTMTTVKPAGTTSKLFGLTEGWHLPAMAYYLRWVQFSNENPLIQKYHRAGYPTRQLVKYNNTTIVGFPTAPAITELGMGDNLVTAGDATPEEQYKWVMLGEKYWIHGTDENCEPLEEQNGNQISYTLKYRPELVDYKHFCDMIKKYQSQVRCCSVMPQEDCSSYEYLPEEPISQEEYSRLVRHIRFMDEEVSREHIDCSTGACPIDFKDNKEPAQEIRSF